MCTFAFIEPSIQTTKRLATDNVFAHTLCEFGVHVDGAETSRMRRDEEEMNEKLLRDEK